MPAPVEVNAKNDRVILFASACMAQVTVRVQDQFFGVNGMVPWTGRMRHAFLSKRAGDFAASAGFLLRS